METAVSEPLKVANGTYDVLLNGKGSVTVLLPDEYPHCIYFPAASQLKPAYPEPLSYIFAIKPVAL